ncbi:tol-pal system protein YbgF [Polynucleobacter paneuropaeus]|jgi:tol-pal system protein YbgF|uniref:Cell division coordinator CpoB n=1 Tax=Polynucleobacter paneuropaeus TaxID=2527775 RepID=A0A9Q2ZWH0_9BURK|nr:tol-pal system protein YbgF [Polynucleobacter paneuropaeus]AWW45604.1 tol-pal system protein YbgF [Polynucleobacter paneuropaeus]MBT8517291.1 tol-pal system protein YbgF [Polynucleobacter paneuropaeus]MBT8518922.1 tol-pal system protein YbgF [Polynucleobacter paneuropaeus]MBT8530859.1 tol-pal system protein YbgF [Polynucleobacter paneuropaeus]MBT8532430.1 tol-pal system protein YbgF [Polynucleobacter paneuropaeus]
MMKLHDSFKQTLLRAFCLSSAVICLTASSSAWALFSDDEARKAILDLRKSLATTQLDLQGQIEKLKADNAELRGKVEELEKQTEEIGNSQKTYYQDLDNRLGNFEPRSITIEGVTGTVQPGEKKAYDESLKAFQAGNLKKADDGFTAFTRKYPNSPYLPLALYWGGNSKYANKDYAGAISQLQTLIKKYPNHPRIAAAMVTLGNCQLESGNKAAAKKTFSDIIAKYPDTDAAKDAQQLLSATK